MAIRHRASAGEVVEGDHPAVAGICILDWDWARDLLLDHELIAEDLGLGAALEAALKPTIWVRRAAA